MNSLNPMTRFKSRPIYPSEGFLKMGVPQIIQYEINHPAIGYPHDYGNPHVANPIS